MPDGRLSPTVADKATLIPRHSYRYPFPPSSARTEPPGSFSTTCCRIHLPIPRMLASSSPKRNGDHLDDSARKRSKVTRACDACRTKKKRCSGHIPCVTCSRQNQPCTYEQEYLRGVPRDPPPAIILSANEDGSPPLQLRNGSPNASSQRRRTETHSARPAGAEIQDVLDPALTSGPPSRRLSPEPENPTNGAHQYHGPTSALSFLGRAWKRLDVSVDHDLANPTSIFSFGDRRVPAPDTADFSWPTLSHARELVRRYFDFAAPTYRVLHESTVFSWLPQLNDSHTTPLSPATEAVLLMVFATASMYQVQSDGSLADADAQAWHESERFCVLAERRMLSETGFPTLESIQCRFLLVLYLLSSSRPNKAWFTHGTAVQLIMTLGIHRRKRTTVQQTVADLVNFECRKRVLWCSYTLDQYLSIILGRPRLLHDYDIDQELPTRVNDEDLNRQIIRSGLGKDCTIDASIFHARLARVLAIANKEQYALTNISDDRQLELSMITCGEIAKWQESLPPFLSGAIQAGSLIPVFRRQLTVLRLAYFHATMFATRSLLMSATKAGRSRRDSMDYRSQLRTCVRAAQHTLELVLAFVDEGQFYPAFWYSQYIAFNALTVVYIYLYQSKKRRIPSSLLQDTTDPVDSCGDENLLNLAQTCQRHLAEATSRNAPAYKYSTILEGLSDSLRRSSNGGVSNSTRQALRPGQADAVTVESLIDPVLTGTGVEPRTSRSTRPSDASSVIFRSDLGGASAAETHLLNDNTFDDFASTPDTTGLFDSYGDDLFGSDVTSDFWSKLDSLPLCKFNNNVLMAYLTRKQRSGMLQVTKFTCNSEYGNTIRRACDSSWYLIDSLVRKTLSGSTNHTLRGTLLKKKLHRFLLRHSSLSRSRSNSSPIGQPHPASSHS